MENNEQKAVLVNDQSRKSEFFDRFYKQSP